MSVERAPARRSAQRSAEWRPKRRVRPGGERWRLRFFEGRIVVTRPWGQRVLSLDELSAVLVRPTGRTASVVLRAGSETVVLDDLVPRDAERLRELVRPTAAEAGRGDARLAAAVGAIRAWVEALDAAASNSRPEPLTADFTERWRSSRPGDELEAVLAGRPASAAAARALAEAAPYLMVWRTPLVEVVAEWNRVRGGRARAGRV